MWNQKQARGFKLYSQPKQSSHQFHQRTARDCPMKRLAMALIAGSATGLSFVAVLQPLPSPAQTISAVPSHEFPKAYVPGLGEFMGRIQVDHAKLWLAGEARNWELAEYQLTELKEVFSDVQDLIPRYQNVPVGDMIDAIITGTIIDLEKATAAREFGKFSADFDKLTEACNSCHQAANRGFIIVKRPALSDFSNQDFTPAKK